VDLVVGVGLVVDAEGEDELERRGPARKGIHARPRDTPTDPFPGRGAHGARGVEGRDGDAEPVQILLPVRFPSFDRMRKGDVFISVVDQEEKYYTGLQVTRDPGVWVVYTGFILMLAGCFITFFMSHQQIMVEVIDTGGKTRVSVSGTANKNKLGMDDKVEKIAKLLAG
jgi:cytochrome c biogenesis protein ResB